MGEIGLYIDIYRGRAVVGRLLVPWQSVYSFCLVFVLVLFCRPVRKTKKTVLTFCLYNIRLHFGGGIATLGMHLPRSLEREMAALLPFYLGYLSNNNLRVKNLLTKYQSFGIGCICCLLLLLLTHWGTVGLVASKIINPLFFFLSTFLGCWMMMSFSASLPWGRKFVAYAGEHTMGILTFHFLSLKLVSLLKISFYGWDIARLAEFPVIKENNTGWWLLYTLAGVGIPLLFTYAHEKLFIKVRIRTLEALIQGTYEYNSM